MTAAESGDIQGAVKLLRLLPDYLILEEAAAKVAEALTAAGQIDWHKAVKTFGLEQRLEQQLLASISVGQARGGDLDGALATVAAIGGPHVVYLAVNTLAEIAVVQVERGDIENANRVVETALDRYRDYCKKVIGCDGYPSDLQWAFARIAWAQAEEGNPDAAQTTVLEAVAIVGDDTRWLDRARYQIALAYARAGELFEAVAAVAVIRRDEWRVQAKHEVEEIIRGLTWRDADGTGERPDMSRPST